MSALRARSAALLADAPQREMPILPHGTNPADVVVVPPTPMGIAASDLAGLISWGSG